MNRNLIIGGFCLAFCALATVAVLNSRDRAQRMQDRRDSWTVVVELPKTNSAKAAPPKVEYRR